MKVLEHSSKIGFERARLSAVPPKPNENQGFSPCRPEPNPVPRVFLKRALVLFLAMLNAVFAAAQADVGTRLPSGAVPKNNKNLCAATPSQTYPCLLDAEFGGVRFTVVGYEPHTRRIRYLATQDENFRTADGLRVGGLIDLAENEIFSMAGWHTMGPQSKDGWRPILGTLLVGNVINSADGEAVDLTKPVPGRIHRFRIIAFDKGGV
jgi:hypothetical protein